MYKLCYYVPATHLESTKAAVFAAGAGAIGEYTCCCWQVLGQGQFIPSDIANPYIGEQGALETVAEYRVEMVCADEIVKEAVAQLKLAHPYEEPAYDVWKLSEL